MSKNVSGFLYFMLGFLIAGAIAWFAVQYFRPTILKHLLSTYPSTDSNTIS